MAALGTILMLVSALLVGVGSFLYNDGHDHTFVGKVSAGIGALALGASWLAQSQQSADEAADCTFYNKGCDKNDSVIEVLGFDDMFIGIIVEMILVSCCAAAGWVVAKLTPRQRADGRSSLVLPWDAP
jgi:hypothetical protein